MKLSVLAIAALSGAATLAAAPTAALAASYMALSIDRTALVMTDLRAPRQIGGLAQTFELVVYRTPTKATGKPRGKTADYLIIEIDFDCAKGRQQQQYSAAYDAGGGFLSSDLKKPSWSKVAPNTKEDALRNLGCQAAKPQIGFPLGDVRVGKVLADYRAGLYDRYIR